MTESWYTFPAQMGDHRAFFSFDNGFSQIADTDERVIFLDVRVVIKQPNEAGLPTNEEFPALSELDEKLDAFITREGGVYVGRLTVNGYRHFYFYIGFTEQIVSRIIASIADETGYSLAYSYKEDVAKDGYWNELYPTSDDWQVIRDMDVLEALKNHNDRSNVERDIRHWGYLEGSSVVKEFIDWLQQSGYQLISVEPHEDNKIKVLFSHTGPATLESITSHSVLLNRRLIAANGDYDGWECEVKRDSAV